MPRILVMQLARLGDVIQTTPLLEQLCEFPPQDEVDILVLECNQDVLHGLGRLGRVRCVTGSRRFKLLDEQVRNGFSAGNIPSEAFDLLKGLNLPHYDRVVNLSYTALKCWLAGRIPCGSREGGTITDQGEWLFSGDPHIYIAALLGFREQNWFNLVDLWRCSAPFRSVPGPASRPCVSVAQDLPFALPEGRKVALNPGSSDAQRCWPPAHFARLAEALAARGLVPILVGAPGDSSPCAAVEVACQVPLPNFCGRTSIPQMARLLSEVALVVSGDTGAVHIASAVGTPLLGLYGATAYFAETAPWGAGHVILQVPPGTEVARFAPELVVATALNRLGLLGEADLRRELFGHNVEGWQTFFLPPDADPVGGVSYRPLRETRIGLAEILTRALRHVLAQGFSSRLGELSLDYLKTWGDPYEWPGGAELEEQAGQMRPGFISVVELLDRMAAAASKGQELCGLGDSQSAASIQATTQTLIQKMEELKTFAAGKAVLHPMVHFLDWKFRMMPMLAPEATFSYHAQEYRKTASMLRQAVALVASFLKQDAQKSVSGSSASL